jgi:hypothetical protein
MKPNYAEILLATRTAYLYEDKMYTVLHINNKHYFEYDGNLIEIVKPKEMKCECKAEKPE